MPAKTHHTAVAILPPEEMWEPIQAIRRRHDRQIHRWMPHVNLLYPFRPHAEFLALVPSLVATCASVASFSVSLVGFRFFRHGSGRYTLWLVPEPAEELQRLQAALQAACPDCDDLSRFPAGFTPHLSVGQFPSLRECERAAEQLQAGWQPITFALTEVLLLARGEATAFVAERRLPLAESPAHSPELWFA